MLALSLFFLPPLSTHVLTSILPTITNDTDASLKFQFEPGGTTAVVVLVKGGNLLCVST